jgi:diguanylate cyclase (GGDEF)-like protein
VAANPHFDFGPYAQILKTLLPRARGIYLYSPEASLQWSSDGAESSDLRPMIVELLERARDGVKPDAAGTRHMLDDAPAYCFLLRDEQGAVLGVVAALCRPMSREGEVPAFDNVERTLAPLLVLARRDLSQQRPPETGRFNVADTQELQWLLDVTRIEAPAAASDGLQALLDAFAARSECDLALLHVPGRHLERTSVRNAVTRPELQSLHAVVNRHLLRVTQLQRRTLIVNKVKDTGAGGLVPFRILCVPLLRRGQVIGVAVAFNRAAGRAFAAREARMLERLVPRLVEIIEARFDVTTGLLTRPAFDEQAAKLLARAPKTPRCVVYADVDQLHTVNELFGFEAGDAVLRAVADTWRRQELRGDSIAARHASDRFVALLDDCSPDAARAWAESTRLEIAALTLPEPWASQSLSASMGVAALAAGGSLEHALAGAEAACRQAKERGRNTVETFAPMDSRAARQQGELKTRRELLAAFEHGRFQLYAQRLAPLWDATRPERFEILVRLQDSRQRPVAASDFLAVAARHQLLARLDRWVFGELLSRLAACGNSLARARAVFSVNVSAESLLQPDLAAVLGDALTAARVSPDLLCFEINESAAVGRQDETQRFIAAVRDLGCGAAIDDYGSGGTSLAFLQSLRLTSLKIDGAFTRNIVSDARSESMLRAILHIARQLELETVAKCVETREAAGQLATLGVTYGQGLALAPPRPLAEVMDEFLRKSAPLLTEAVARPPGDKRVH